MDDHHKNSAIIIVFAERRPHRKREVLCMGEATSLLHSYDVDVTLHGDF
jgi:hypothetical protein